MQNAWERSGKFEGDIVLTDEQLRNGLNNPPVRWQNKEIPIVIDSVFSEYCSTKLQIAIQGVEGIIHAL